MKYNIILFYLLFIFSLMLNSCDDSPKYNTSDIFKLNINVDSVNTKNLKLVKQDFKNQILNKLSSISFLNKDYEAYIYDEKLLNSKKLVFIYIVRDSYAAIHLIILDLKNNLESNYEIAGGLCAGPYEDSTGIYWCDKKFSTFINDSIFMTTIISQKSNDYINSPLYINIKRIKNKITENGSIIKLSSKEENTIKYLDDKGNEKK